MRGYRTQIKDAELMAISPEAVAEYLKQRAESENSDGFEDYVDDETEQALLSRNDPIIDLALAQYSKHMSVVATLFRSAEPSSAIRLACLTNKFLKHEIVPFFPVGLLGREVGPLSEWIINASEVELFALFENPSLGDRFLSELLERRSGWEVLPDSRLCSIVSILSRNSRMRTPRDDDFMDGWLEHRYRSVFDAAWKLAETASVNENWAAALGRLFEHLVAESSSISDPLKIAARWYVDASDAKAHQEQSSDHAIGILSDKERVRKGLARLAIKNNRYLSFELLDSDDLAFRCAAYSHSRLSVDQLQSGYEKDGYLTFSEAVRNLYLWKDAEARQALQNIAWDVVRNDKNSDLIAANLYNWMEGDVRKKYPEWFSEQEGFQSENDGDQKIETVEHPNQFTRAIDDEESLSQLLEIKENVSLLSNHLERHAQRIDSLNRDLKSLMRRSIWILWFSLGTLIFSLRYF